MKIKGHKLIFISQICRDGKGVELCEGKDMSYAEKEIFSLRRLSITHETFVACKFNSFVVKLKHKSK